MGNALVAFAAPHLMKTSVTHHIPTKPHGVLKRRTPGKVKIIRLVDFIKSTGPSKALEVFPAGLLNVTGRI